MASALSLTFDVLVSLAFGGLIYAILMLFIERRPMLVAQRRLQASVASTGLTGGETPEGQAVVPPLLVMLLRWGRVLGRLPLLKSLVDVLARSQATTKTKHSLVIARLEQQITVRDFVAARVAMGLVAALTLLPLWFAGNPAVVLLSIVLFAIGYVFPSAMLNRLAQTRQQDIQRALSRATDVFVVAVEAGLTFEKAVDLYIERFQGPLAEELARVQQAIRVGQRQQDATMEMVERLDVEDLRLLMTSILQAQRFGVPIADILRSLSEDLKRRREQRIRTESMKAPVRMIFPIVLFLLPAVFAIIFGPIILQFVAGGGPF
jgi:tight adherence protein C